MLESCRVASRTFSSAKGLKSRDDVRELILQKHSGFYIILRALHLISLLGSFKTTEKLLFYVSMLVTKVNHLRGCHKGVFHIGHVCGGLSAIVGFHTHSILLNPDAFLFILRHQKHAQSMMESRMRVNILCFCISLGLFCAAE